MSKRAKKKKSNGKSGRAVHPQVYLDEELYIQRLLILIEARDTHQHGQMAYFDLGGGERPQIVKAEFDSVARREKIPVLVHPVKGKPTLAFVFPPGGQKEAEVIVRGADGVVKFRSGNDPVKD